MSVKTLFSIAATVFVVGGVVKLANMSIQQYLDVSSAFDEVNPVSNKPHSTSEDSTNIG